MTRHRFDVFSFLTGAVALTVAALVLIGDLSIRLVDLRVIGPVVVLAVGLALLFGGRQRDRDDATVAGAGDRAGGAAVLDEDPALLLDDDEPAWHEIVDDGHAAGEPVDEPRTETQRIEPDEIHTERIDPDDR